MKLLAWVLPLSISCKLSTGVRPFLHRTAVTNGSISALTSDSESQAIVVDSVPDEVLEEDSDELPLEDALGESTAQLADVSALKSDAVDRRNQCDPPPGNTCVCINPKYPCYRWHPKKERCVCSGVRTEGQCTQIGGSFCKRPTSCVEHCKVCKDSSSCQQCEQGFQLVAGQCQDQAAAFSGMAHARKGNLVLLGSSEVFQALSDGFEGKIRRSDAVDFALRAFLHLYKDRFDAVFVVPGEPLPGRQSHGQNFHLKGDGSSESKLRSTIILQMYGPRVAAIPLIHELEHAWGVFGDVEKLTPGRLRTCGPHWGMTAFDRFGMLGGFPRSAVQCSNGGTLEDLAVNGTTCEQPLLWDFSQGSARTSHDNIGGFSKFDLMLMGLLDAKELGDEKLVYCEGAKPTHGRGQQPVSCTKLHVITAAELDEAMDKRRRIAKGTTLRAAVVVVMPSNDAVQKEEASDSFETGSNLAWLNEYIAKTPDVFSSYSLGLASLDFGVTSDDMHIVAAAVDSADETLDEAKDTLNAVDDEMEKAKDALNATDVKENVAKA